MIDLLRDIEARALELGASGTTGLTMEIDDDAPAIKLPMERPLYTPINKPRIDSSGIYPAAERRRDRPCRPVRAGLRRSRPLRGQCPRRASPRQPGRAGRPSSGQCRSRHGVAELVAYLSLRDEAFTLVYDEASAEQISWTGADDQRRTATLPRVTFTRADAGTQGRGIR